MKNILFSIAFSISFLFSQGQVVCNWANVKYGVELKKPIGKYYDARYIDEDLFIIYKKRGLFTFYQYDDNLMPIGQTSINTEHRSTLGKYYFIEVLDFAGKKWVVSRIKNGEELKFYYYVQELDFKNRKVVGDPIELVSINFLRSGRLEKLHFQENETGDKLLVMYNDANAELTEYVFGAKLFSSAWKVENESAFKLAKEDMRTTVIYFELTSKNEITATKKISYRDKETKEWILHKYDLSGDIDNPEEEELEIDEEIDEHGLGVKATFQTETIFENSTGDETVGLYWDTTSNRTLGVAYYKKSLSETSNNEMVLNEFEISDLRSTNTDIYQNSKTVKTDKGYYVFAEKQYKIETRYVDSETGRYKKSGWETFFVDMFIAKLDMSGNLEWLTVLPKKSELGGNYYENPNLIFGVFEEEVYLAYETNNGKFSMGKNTYTNPDPEIRGTVNLAKISGEDGELITSRLFDPEDKKLNRIRFVKFMPGTGQFLISKEVKKGLQYGIINIE